MSVYSIETLRQLSVSLFSRRYSEPVSNFLLPALARDARFPFVRLLYSLLPPEIAAGIDSVTELSRDWCLAVEPTIWLLHSTLTLATHHLGLSSCSCSFLFALQVQDRFFMMLSIFLLSCFLSYCNLLFVIKSHYLFCGFSSCCAPFDF